MVTEGKLLILMAEAKEALQPVVAEVKVKLTVPAATGDTTPWLDTAAIPKLDEAQLPPDEGERLSVLPIHTFWDGAETTGLAFTVMALLASEAQPVVELTKVNVAVPALMAVITPPLVMVATAVLLEDQVPPLAGVMVVVLPTHKVVWDGWVIVGLLLTIMVTSLLSRLQTLPVSLVNILLNLCVPTPRDAVV